MTYTPVTAGRIARGDHSWIRVAMAASTVWMATEDGLALIDLIAVERAINGERKGWTLTADEARYAAALLFQRGMSYSVIANRVGVSGSTLKAWFPERAVPTDARRSRPGTRKSSPTRVIKCGTRQGYGRHHRRGEPACQPCKDANAVADRYYRLHGTYVGAPELEVAV